MAFFACLITFSPSSSSMIKKIFRLNLQTLNAFLTSDAHLLSGPSVVPWYINRYWIVTLSGPWCQDLFYKFDLKNFCFTDIPFEKKKRKGLNIPLLYFILYSEDFLGWII